MRVALVIVWELGVLAAVSLCFAGTQGITQQLFIIEDY